MGDLWQYTWRSCGIHGSTTYRPICRLTVEIHNSPTALDLCCFSVFSMHFSFLAFPTIAEAKTKYLSAFLTFSGLVTTFVALKSFLKFSDEETFCTSFYTHYVTFLWLRNAFLQILLLNSDAFEYCYGATLLEGSINSQ